VDRVSGAPPRRVFDRRFLRDVWRLARAYWASPDARWGGLLLTVAVVLELGTVWGNLLVADAERRLLDALAGKDAAGFVAAIATFLAVTLVFLVAATYRIYTRQLLEVRWRRALTADYVGRWLGAHAYLQSELHPGVVDNPDQRIQEDVRDFVASALGLSMSLVAAVATLGAFGVLLWKLSAGFPLTLGASSLHVPGFMLWVAIAYGLLSMWVTHLVGRRLVPINFDRLRFEADFRYGLMRFRDKAETVALSRGEEVERRRALQRFGHIVRNWWALIGAQRNLALLTGGIGAANNVVPVLVAVPGYLAGAITLGTIVQIRIAYGQVSGALAWFVYAYQEIARWRANVERLATLSEVVDDTTLTFAKAGIRLAPGDPTALRLHRLRIDSPDGRVLLDEADATVRAGDHVVISGPSGTGKTLLLRAIAGVWPFGSGRVEVPTGARMLFVTQWPYVPVDTLRAAVSYPSPENAFPDERIAEALKLLGLDRLAARLDDVEQWDQLLSPHEQQRLALARVLLHEPDWILLDKATSALDEVSERVVYQVLADRLPKATLVSVAHRPGLERYHPRRWSLTPSGGHVVLEAA
jgi:putative ATP-binding cassette transporter